MMCRSQSLCATKARRSPEALYAWAGAASAAAKSAGAHGKKELGHLPMWKSPKAGAGPPESRACAQALGGLSHKDRPPQPPKTNPLRCLFPAYTPPSTRCPPPNTAHQTAHQPATMAPRTKKEDTGELMVSIEQYTRTRDSVCIFISYFFCRAATRMLHVIVPSRHQSSHKPARITCIIMRPLDTRMILIASITRPRHGVLKENVACVASQTERKSD